LSSIINFTPHAQFIPLNLFGFYLTGMKPFYLFHRVQFPIGTSAVYPVKPSLICLFIRGEFNRGDNFHSSIVLPFNQQSTIPMVVVQKTKTKRAQHNVPLFTVIEAVRKILS